MAKFKLTTVQQFRLLQAQETILSIIAEINGNGRAKGDSYFAVIHLSSADRNIGETLAIANPPTAAPTTSPA